MEKKKFNLFGDLTETWKGFKNESIRPLTMILVIINIVCLLVSNIIAAKHLRYLRLIRFRWHYPPH